MQMIPALRPSTLALFLGDVLCFAAALWLSLYLRAFEVPPRELLQAYALAMVPLVVLWVGVYFIAGLYERRRLLLARRDLSESLLAAQVVNVIIAALFFFFVPFFGIAPKTILIIYLVVSFLLVLLWRAFLYPRMGLQRPEPALIVGGGREMEELWNSLGKGRRAPLKIVAAVDAAASDAPAQAVRAVERFGPCIIVADLGNPATSRVLPDLYNLLSRGVRFIDAPALFEDLFGRVPLSYVNDRWLARNVSRGTHALYDPLKRAIDFTAGLCLCLVFFALYPLFALIIKFQDGGPVFYTQVRIGQNSCPFIMRKFRSMTGTDEGSEVLKSNLAVTPFGKFLRVSRLDEFPQALNVLGGDLSLIGPRPEFPALVEEYAKKIPHYKVRHLVKPGLSGWAQLYHDNHPHHGEEVEATREKLSYDLYYLKHRSLMLDIVIALKTLKKMVTKSGI